MNEPNYSLFLFCVCFFGLEIPVLADNQTRTRSTSEPNRHQIFPQDARVGLNRFHFRCLFDEPAGRKVLVESVKAETFSLPPSGVLRYTRHPGEERKDDRPEAASVRPRAPLLAMTTGAARRVRDIHAHRDVPILGWSVCSCGEEEEDGEEEQTHCCTLRLLSQIISDNLIEAAEALGGGTSVCRSRSSSPVSHVDSCSQSS